MTWTRLLLTWLLLAVLMPVNGIVREAGFKRLMPDRAAETLSVATGIALILVVTRWLFRVPADEPAVRLALQAVTLVGLTVAYEFAIGFAGGRSMRELAGHYAVWRGELWPFVLAVLAATPWLWRGRGLTAP